METFEELLRRLENNIALDNGADIWYPDTLLSECDDDQLQEEAYIMDGYLYLDGDKWAKVLKGFWNDNGDFEREV